MMDFNEEQRLREITRRHFFRDCRVGLGSMALGSLLAAEKTLAAALTTVIC